MNSKPPVLLMILDGWGLNPRSDYNAVAQANTPNLDHLFSVSPHSELKCSGEAVGLPEGQMGNSEVGHLNMGAGRRIYQAFTRINKDIENETFYRLPTLNEAMGKAAGGSLHLIGLVSDGGVHSHIKHLFALLEKARRTGLTRVFVHALLDGRDTAPKVADTFLEQLEDRMAELGVGKIATIMGRYYGMDRDNRWERTRMACDALVSGAGRKAESVREALNDAFSRGETDEFVKPTIIIEEEQPTALIKNDDTVIFFNFRPDRARQLTRALTATDFDNFPRQERLRLNYYCMTEYDQTFKLPVIYPSPDVTDSLGEVLSRHNMPQLRIAETEKYAHVTFFFNGGREDCFQGEERALIHSPKVATYDLQPEMSAYPVADEVVKRIRSRKYQVIILNFANLDMVGHTGVLEAAVKAVEAVDACVGKVISALEEVSGVALITADHGNAEQMLDYETGVPFTAHTTNPVPFILHGHQDCEVRNGELVDIPPTILQILGIPQPEIMTGQSLIKQN